MKSFSRLKGFFLEHKWSYLFGVFWLLVIDLVQVIVPKIIGSLTDDLQNHTLDPNSIIKYSIYIILTGLIIGVGRYFWRIYILGTSRTLEYHLRKELFNHLLTLSPNYFNTHKTGDLMAHATNDINAVRMALGFGIIMMIDSLFIIVLSLSMMVTTTSLRLTAIAVFNLPFIMILTRRFGKIIYKRFRSVQEAFSNLTDITQESFAGMRVIKSFVQEDLVSENFTKVNQDNFDKNLGLVKVSGALNPFLQFIASISLLIIIFYGGREVILQRITLGDFIAFNSYLGLLIWPTRALGQVINVIQRGSASMDRLNSILDEKSEILDAVDPVQLDVVKGKIEFNNVSFKYPNSNYNALSNINFVIEPGKTLALVGRTGCGKTTIANVLLRLYDISEGQILLDDVDIKDIWLKTLRENIGYVPQDGFLFSQTIEENIGFSFDEKPEHEKVVAASKAAELYDNIIEFPFGFETVMGERGVTLSGGQKQRTSIARALIKDPAILILDDSLSAVDTQTEEKILNNLNQIMADTTRIIISHRISTIKDADEILFLDEGKIIERGEHEELLLLNGEYKDLYNKQLLEEKVGHR